MTRVGDDVRSASVAAGGCWSQTASSSLIIEIISSLAAMWD